MILSAPATAALHVPVISIAPALDSKDPKVSETNAFKTVFESLTLFEDLEQQGGAKQESDATPASSAKKEPPTDASYGTEALAVPQMTNPTPAKPPLTARLSPPATLSPSADNHALDKQETPQEKAAPQSSSPRTDNGFTAQVTTTRSAVLDLRAGTVLARTATSSEARRAATTPASTKVQATRVFESQPTGAPQANQPAMPVTNRPTVAPYTISKPFTAKSVLLNTAAPTTEHVADEAGQETPVRVPVGATQLKVSPQASNPPMAATSPTVRPIPVAPPAANPRRAVETTTTPQVRRNSVYTPLPTAQPSARVTINPVPVRARFTAPPSSAAPAGDSNTIAQATAATKPFKAATDVRPSNPAPLPAPQNVPAPVRPTSAADATVPSSTDTSSADTSSADLSLADTPSSTPPPTLPTLATQPEPTLAAPAAVVTASTTLPPPATPASVVPQVATNRAAEPPSLPPTQHETLIANPAPKIPLLPQAENFAFAVRMLGLGSSSSRTPAALSKPLSAPEVPVTQSKDPVTPSQSPAARQPDTSQAQSSNESHFDAVTSAPQNEKSQAVAQSQADLLGTQQKVELVPRANDTAVFQAPRIEPLSDGIEFNENPQPNAGLAAQESHLLTPELPKTTASSEILLHLTDGDQSLAAVRVADRAGSVNVSVHASDPALRESLRSNLGELSNQLNQQGWKADVIKSAVAATHPESQQDSHSGDQRGSQQQPPSGGDRQAQRERRGNGGQWRQELEQQISGDDARPGGKR